ncbi:HAD-IC family P-type ATPase [Salipiger mangrovisoli]|uniref:Cation-transporting P-type ATPase n=1 Tax=Salipiger mangrovisoli TaxID=2865933 RepID=A0ABR9X6T7_9RHOB|nr:cation-transporting P-type ATPase [Salipiger mangrovisoli]
MSTEPAPDTPYHALSREAVLARLGGSVAGGLSEAEAATRLARFGRNSIAAKQRLGALTVVLRQLRSPVVFLLGGAAVLALVFGEIGDAAAIAAILLLNALIGVFTEIKAARSIESLRALDTRSARVRRDGHERQVSAELLVPGDIVVLDAGDAVPADMRLLECSNLQVDESTLTGESVAVAKSAAPVPEAARLGDRHAMLFRGTALTRGLALGIVTGTGLATEIGKVSRLVAEAGAGSSPLERKLARLSAQLVWAVTALAVVLSGVGLLTGKDPLLMVEAAIALAVAAIPEGLPIVATLTLARGMWRMARQNALVEHLSAVETLGATTLILTDKTGTLTENRMAVRSYWPASGRQHDAGAGEPPSAADAAGLAALVEVAVLCNGAALDDARAEGAGDPMERALLRAGLEAGRSREALLQRFPLVRQVAFDTATRMMATVHAAGDAFRYAIKGAPEAVLQACSFDARDGATPLGAAGRAEWLRRVEAMAEAGLRVLACAERTDPRPDAAPYAGLTFLGLIGLEDPARSDVPQAIEACHRAGIRVVMVTGDHATTALSISRTIGLQVGEEGVAEGVDAAHLAAGIGALDRIGVFARVSPQEKLAIVRAFQSAGEIVAMTGDGVNDAPALRQADIGVAMGRRGTDVAREAAAMILLDDAFPTIVAAIREGRVIFGNIRRFAAYLLACNLSEVLVVGLAVLSSLPLPILPLQILYLNLITDVFPAFALALGEGEGNVLARPPRDPREPILGRPQWLRLLAQGLLMTAGVFLAMWASGGMGLSPDETVTVTFLTLAVTQLWQVFNMRAGASGILSNEITRNPWIWAALALCLALLALPPYIPPLAGVLGVVPPDAGMWALVLGLGALPMLAWQVAISISRKTRFRHDDLPLWK